MGANHSFKKTAALVLSGVLTLGAVPLSPLVQDAHADTASTISKVAYATKDELGADIPPLIESKTAYTGDVTKVGRIKLGKAGTSGTSGTSDAPVMEWYLLGADNGGVAIFAASDISNSQKFSEGTGGYPAWDEKYGKYTNVTVSKDTNTELYYNHYGASDLRKTLRKMGGESDDGTKVSSNYFSDAELDMLQATTVMTQDYKNGSPAVYTTTDKLYAAWGDPKRWNTDGDGDDYAIGEESSHIYIGSKSGKKKEGIEITLGNSLLGATTWFWLRSPRANISNSALVANSSVSDNDVNDGNFNYAVRPASNLNLSSVIFASAASAASSDTAVADTIQTSASNKDAMTLRLNPAKYPNGTQRTAEVKIGTATADTTSKSITATKDEKATGTVALVVQGEHTENGKSVNWYYSKQIGSSTETIKVDDIAAALVANGVKLSGTTAEDTAACIDLSKCKIWLETPVDAATTTLSYAVEAVEQTHTHTYPATGDEDYWNGHNGEYHWQECTDTDCPNKDGSIQNKTPHPTTGEFTTNDTDADHHWKVCPDCGEIIKDTVKEHSPSNWTPDDDGEHHTGTCDDCGHVVTGDHSYVHTSDERYHWNECEDCGYEEPGTRGEHTFGEDGKCSDDDCNYDLRTGHDLRWDPRVEPTCDEVGYEGHWECDNAVHSGKGEIFIKNELGLIVFTDLESITIPAKVHTAGDTYVKIDDTYDAPVCEDCDEPITDRKELHYYDEDGICAKCGHNKSDHTHVYDGIVWKSNATYHWHICTICGEKIGDTQERHSFSGRTCTICEYVKHADDSDDDDSDAGVSSDSGVSGTWHQDSKGWRFEYTNGSYARGRQETNGDGTTTMYVGWVKTGGKWYAFDTDGYMVSDWVYDAQSGCWYYCDVNNGMQKGWLYTPVDNCWYYLDPANGKMHTAWSLIDGKYYYFSEMHNGTYYQDPSTGKWIYLNLPTLRPLGSMYAATLTPDGSLVGADGAYIPQ